MLRRLLFLAVSASSIVPPSTAVAEGRYAIFGNLFGVDMAWRVDTHTGALVACTRGGCARAPLPGGPTGRAADQPHYAATLSTTNSLWLVDTWSGEVWRCGRASCEEQGLAPVGTLAGTDRPAR